MSIDNEFCCDEMKENVYNDFILYNEVFDEFGIPLIEDNLSMLIMKYCPWCGKRLPNSLREKWFNELESKGFLTPLFDDNIPTEYKSKKWREK